MKRLQGQIEFLLTVDRLKQVFRRNYLADGKTWREQGVTLERVMAVNARIAEGAPALWDFVRGEIETAALRGEIVR